MGSANKKSMGINHCVLTIIQRVKKEPSNPKSHKEKIKIKSKDNTIINVRYFFTVLKERKTSKDKILKDIKNLFELGKEEQGNCCKQKLYQI